MENGKQRQSVSVGSGRAKPEGTRLPVGQLVHDTRQDKRAIVMDHEGGLVWLRPERGGTEWTARAGDLRPVEGGAGARALLSARVADANARSRGEAL
ncbi:hypothetical protein AB0O01_11730 [Streptomyces sp. NPDC093252]|uniref:hypothetical protein n=1 Tax=Streptomyces sp. NPDC093252 TaxID=3154980 RepID=UPI003446FAB0